MTEITAREALEALEYVDTYAAVNVPFEKYPDVEDKIDGAINKVRAYLTEQARKESADGQ